MPPFILSVRDQEGFEVELKPGGHAEHDLINGIVDRVKSQAVEWFKADAVAETLKDKQIGFFTTKARVIETVNAAVQSQGLEVLEDKIVDALTKAIKDTLYALKSDVKPV